jgi:hypothetical protein
MGGAMTELVRGKKAESNLVLAILADGNLGDPNLQRKQHV